MLTCLFWNVCKKPLQAAISNLVVTHQVDLLFLAECVISENELLRELNQYDSRGGPASFGRPDANSLCDRIVVYHRNSAGSLKIEKEGHFYTGRVLRLAGREEILLFAVHLASKLYRSSESQSLGLPMLSQTIREVESRRGHRRTVLVGDFNVNPFEIGVVGAEGLNAVMTRAIARKKKRVIDRVEHPFFYNPMWGLFGDAGHEEHPPESPDHSPSGTCYYPPGESVWYYWNMFDQVLLRPDLVPFFRHRELKILVTDGVTSFLNRQGVPDRVRFSDHLPVLFRLQV